MLEAVAEARCSTSCIKRRGCRGASRVYHMTDTITESVTGTTVPLLQKVALMLKQHHNLSYAVWLSCYSEAPESLVYVPAVACCVDCSCCKEALLSKRTCCFGWHSHSDFVALDGLLLGLSDPSKVLLRHCFWSSGLYDRHCPRRWRSRC